MTKFREAFGSFADFLQVISFDWKSVAPYLASAGVLLIGWLKDVSPIVLAVMIPLVFCLMLFLGVLVRIWGALNKTQPKLGLPPYLAQNEYVDAAITKERHDATLNQFNVWAQLELAERELKSVRRRQSRTPALLIFEEEDAVINKIEGLSEQKDLADMRCNIAEQHFMGDLYNKLRDGNLIAVGFVQPAVHGKPPVDIPALEWEFLTFDDNMRIASGEGISYLVISIRTKKT